MKLKAKRVARALAAAVTSPAAVKEEKSLAVLIGARLGLNAGALAGLVALGAVIVKALS